MIYYDNSVNAPNSFNTGYGAGGGGQNAANNAVLRSATLFDDAQAVAEGLSTLHQQLDQLSSKLLGPMPCTPDGQCANEQIPSLRSLTANSRERVEQAVQCLSSILSSL